MKKENWLGEEWEHRQGEDYIRKEDLLTCQVSPELATIQLGDLWEGTPLTPTHKNLHLLQRFHKVRGPDEKTVSLEKGCWLREDLRRLDEWTHSQGGRRVLLPKEAIGGIPSWGLGPFYKGAAKQKCRERILRNWGEIVEENQNRDRLVYWTLGGEGLQDTSVLLRGGVPLQACHSFEEIHKVACGARIVAGQIEEEYPGFEVIIEEGRIETLTPKTLARGKKRNLPNYIFLDTTNMMGTDFRQCLVTTLLEIFRNPPAKYESVPLRLDMTLMRGREDLTKGWEKLKVYNTAGEPVDDHTGLQKARQVLRMLNDYLRPEGRVGVPNGEPIAYQNEGGGTPMLYIPTVIQSARHSKTAEEKIQRLGIEP